jgi:hypothetical protein
MKIKVETFLNYIIYRELNNFDLTENAINVEEVNDFYAQTFTDEALRISFLSHLNYNKIVSIMTKSQNWFNFSFMYAFSYSLLYSKYAKSQYIKLVKEELIQ